MYLSTRSQPFVSGPAGTYRLQIAERVADLNEDDWDSLRADTGNLFMDRRFVEAVENSRPGGGKLWSVLVYEADRPVAAACLSLLNVDAGLVAGGRTKRAIALIRRLFPDFLRFNVLFCGLPVSASQAHLLFSPDADRRQVLRLLDRQMQTLARKHRAGLLVFKEFAPEACADLVELAPLSYLKLETTVVSYLECEFADMDEYCTSLRSQYRRKIFRSQRKFAAAGLRLEVLGGGKATAARYTDEVHQLYESVVERSKTKLETLPAEFFRELARQFPQEFYLILASRGEQVVGFGCGLRMPIGEPMFIGFERGQKERGDVYLNLMYSLLAEVLSHGVRGICWGATADDFKASLGCEQRPYYAFVRATNWLQRALPLMARFLFPPLPLDEPLHVFHTQKADPVSHGPTGDSGVAAASS